VLSPTEIVKFIDATDFSLIPGFSVVKDLVFDSRKIITPFQSLFFAIKTANDDGHKYIDELFHKGVVNFVISQPIQKYKSYNANFYQVEDTVIALQKIAVVHRNQFTYPVIGITGSNGKTTVKEWLAQVLSDDFNIVKNPNSFNSQIGVPLSVWQMSSKETLGIFEAGISTVGEMGKLEHVIQPGIGILCNIGDAHAAHFSGIHEKLNEKLKLFIHSKYLVYCSDHTLIHYVLQDQKFQKIQKLSWGFHDDSKYKIDILNKQTHKTTINFNGFPVPLEIPFTDDASIENCCHIAVILLHFSYSISDINERLATLSHLSMRMEIKEAMNRSIVINDTYSLDINSLKIALDFLGTQSQFEKKTLILSDFDQVYLSEDDFHHIAQIIKEHQIKKLVLVGHEIGKHLSIFDVPKKLFYEYTDQLFQNISDLNINYEAVLVKGARKFQFEKIVHAIQLKSHQTVLQVDLGAITNNLNFYRSLLQPNTKLMAMVKALSYGLGDAELINELRYHNIDYLAVAYVDEGVALRKRKINTPIVVLGAEAAGFSTMIQYDLEPEIFNFHYLKRLIETLHLFPEKQNYPIHIKLDTGMHRLGFDQEDILELTALLKLNKQIRIASVFSHFAASEDPKEDTFTTHQATQFQNTCNIIEKEMGYSFMCHIANSAAISRFKEYHFNCVRLGLGLYGYTAVKEDQQKLQNTVTLKSIITQLKNVKKDDTIGYNRTFVAQNDMKVAIVPIGYADGYPKELSNGKGSMIVCGKKCPVVGKICMDMTMIDVTGLDVHEEDEVIIYNDQNNLNIISESIQKSPYELLTAISKRVQRIYIRD
jgi:Alr-MurF fusion protein